MPIHRSSVDFGGERNISIAKLIMCLHELGAARLASIELTILLHPRPSSFLTAASAMHPLSAIRFVDWKVREKEITRRRIILCYPEGMIDFLSLGL